jgi:FKBP12-rapamycin complex-associated protein
MSFSPKLNVMTSKQRPRKLSMNGSDGKPYQYLLKGHEDLRQDERVMQLFGLVNTLLVNDAETFKRHLQIQRYGVTPLSPNSGLIGWVADCGMNVDFKRTKFLIVFFADTLHDLVKDFRERRKIPINMEHRLISQVLKENLHELYPLLETKGND